MLSSSFIQETQSRITTRDMGSWHDIDLELNEEGEEILEFLAATMAKNEPSSTIISVSSCSHSQRSTFVDDNNKPLDNNKTEDNQSCHHQPSGPHNRMMVPGILDMVEFGCQKILVEDIPMDRLGKYFTQLGHHLSLLNDDDDDSDEQQCTLINSPGPLNSRLTLVSMIHDLLSIHDSYCHQDRDEDNLDDTSFFSVYWTHEDWKRVEEQLVLTKSIVLRHTSAAHKNLNAATRYNDVIRAVQVQAEVAKFYHRLNDLRNHNNEQKVYLLAQFKQVVDSYVNELSKIFADCSDNKSIANERIPNSLISFLLPQLYQKDMSTLAQRLLNCLESAVMFHSKSEFSYSRIQRNIRSLLIHWNNCVMASDQQPTAMAQHEQENQNNYLDQEDSSHLEESSLIGKQISFARASSIATTLPNNQYQNFDSFSSSAIYSSGTKRKNYDEGISSSPTWIDHCHFEESADVDFEPIESGSYEWQSNPYGTKRARISTW